MLALPALWIADIKDLEFELSPNRSTLSITGERKLLPTIKGAIINVLLKKHFEYSVDFPSAITLVGLEAELVGGMATVQVKKGSGERVVVGGVVGSVTRQAIDDDLYVSNNDTF